MEEWETYDDRHELNSSKDRKRSEPLHLVKGRDRITESLSWLGFVVQHVGLLYPPRILRVFIGKVLLLKLDGAVRSGPHSGSTTRVSGLLDGIPRDYWNGDGFCQMATW